MPPYFRTLFVKTRFRPRRIVRLDALDDLEPDARDREGRLQTHACLFVLNGLSHRQVRT